MFKEALISLLPVIAGGAIAILGSAIVPVISDYLAARNTKRTARAKNIEELLEKVHEHRHWIENERVRIIFSDQPQTQTSPLTRAQVISAVHFPDYYVPLADLEVATSEFMVWAASAKVRWLKEDYENINEGMREAYAEYISKSSAVIIPILKYIKAKNGDF